jgi:hypothetical protein
MDLPGASYLYTLATLSVTFVGFSALVIVLRQTFGGELSKLDILITRIFIQLGFMVAACAMLPPLLVLCLVPQPVIWRICSLCTAVPSFLFAVTYPARRRAANGGAETPLAIWIDVFLLVFAALVLLANGLAIGLTPAYGPYAGALTGILFISGWAYLQALNTLLGQHTSTWVEMPAKDTGRQIFGRLPRLGRLRFPLPWQQAEGQPPNVEPPR